MVKIEPKQIRAKDGPPTRSLQSSKLTDNHSFRHSVNCSCASSVNCSSASSVHTLGKGGHGRKVSDLKRRAKAAYFTKNVVRHLAALDSPLADGYKFTAFMCGNTIIQEGQKLTAKYCDRRWCTVCNRIRTAKLINGYSKPIEAMKEPMFLTLTVPNAIAADLRPCIERMNRNLALSIKAVRRQKKACDGIRKLEITYNDREDTYHPHYHIIVDGLSTAEEILSQWMKHNPDASLKGQDIRPADSGSITELLKYSAKVVTKTSKNFASSSSPLDTSFAIYISALDTIYQALDRKQTIRPFGKIKKVKEEIDELVSETYEDLPFVETDVWIWHESGDWYSTLTGRPLTGYIPSRRMQELVSHSIIT